MAPVQAASAKAFYFGGGHQKEQQEKRDQAEQKQHDLWDDFSNFEEKCDFSQTRIALEWYKRAAAKGHSKALYNLASLMARGEGLPLSTDGAEQLLRQAAHQGYARAQYALALHLMRRAEDLRRARAMHSTDARPSGRKISRQGAGGGGEGGAGQATVSRELKQGAQGEKIPAPPTASGHGYMHGGVGAMDSEAAFSPPSEKAEAASAGGLRTGPATDPGGSPGRGGAVGLQGLHGRGGAQGDAALEEEATRWLVAAAGAQYGKAAYALGLRCAEGRGGVVRPKPY